MKILLPSLVRATVLASVPLFVPVAPAQNKPPLPARSRKAKADNHPKIRGAIAALEAAKAELEQANGDFGGHKTEAIEAVNNALKRLRLALQFEKY